MPFTIKQGDITRMHVDAIVNAANHELSPGCGVCGAIFGAAGCSQLEWACRAIGRCETGQAVITDGFALPARYVIHTVGPVWRGGGAGEEALLASCYRSSLELARQYDCRSVAFPLISAGIFGYPRQEALAVARAAIEEFLEKREMAVYLMLYDKASIELLS